VESNVTVMAVVLFVFLATSFFGCGRRGYSVLFESTKDVVQGS
jgi:hypothetical protein